MLYVNLNFSVSAAGITNSRLYLLDQDVKTLVLEWLGEVDEGCTLGVDGHRGHDQVSLAINQLSYHAVPLFHVGVVALEFGLQQMIPPCGLKFAQAFT